MTMEQSEITALMRANEHRQSRFEKFVVRCMALVYFNIYSIKLGCARSMSRSSLLCGIAHVAA